MTRNIAAFILVALIWGSTWLVIKDQISAVPVGWTVTWRFALATLGMFALALVRRDALRLPRPAMLLAAVTGVFQFALNFQLVYRSEHYLTSGIVAVFFALLLVPNALFARAFVGTPVTPRFIGGSAVALGGIALLFLHEYRIAPAGSGVLTGIVLVTCALFSASTSNVLLATDLARRQAIVPFIAWSMLWGTLGNALFAWLTTGAPVFDPRPAYLAGIAYLAIIGSVVTFPLYTALIREWGPGRAAYNGVAVPVVAMGLSTLFEG
ncbi:MAG TPA: EamA family transporter [Novosphingobium sp.]|nr:EamA family transporter [Novosphingobium sp.]